MASPASPQQHTVKVGYLTSWSADCRRLPCHAPFHIACVTDTGAPFTAAYLNMTPNNVNNSAICQFVCNARKNGGKKNDICSFSFDLVWFRLLEMTCTICCLLDRRLITQQHKYMCGFYNQAEQRRSSLPNLIQQQATMPQWYRIYCASITHARYKKPPNYSCLWVVLTKACRNGHTPPSGNMTVSWWPHDRFISQHSTLLFLILAGLLRNGLAHLHGCSEATMRTLQQKSGATQFYGGTAGILAGAWGVRQEPRWSSPCGKYWVKSTMDTMYKWN